MSIDNLFMPDSGIKPSVQDDLWTIAESSNHAVTDMKFVFDVYVTRAEFDNTTKALFKERLKVFVLIISPNR